MKLIITTTYDNLDWNWFDWYCQRLAVQQPTVAAQLKRDGFARFQSNDPTSPATGVTTYKVESGQGATND